MIKKVSTFIKNVLNTVKNESFEEIDKLIEEKDMIVEMLRKNEKNQFKRVKLQLVNTRNSQLFFKINSEVENLLLHSINLVKSERDFITFTRQHN